MLWIRVQTVRLSPTLSDSVLCFVYLSCSVNFEKRNQGTLSLLQWVSKPDFQRWEEKGKMWHATKLHLSDQFTRALKVQIRNNLIRTRERVQTPAMSAKMSIYPAEMLLRMTLPFDHIIFRSYRILWLPKAPGLWRGPASFANPKSAVWTSNEHPYNCHWDAAFLASHCWVMLLHCADSLRHFLDKQVLTTCFPLFEEKSLFLHRLCFAIGFRLQYLMPRVVVFFRINATVSGKLQLFWKHQSVSRLSLHWSVVPGSKELLGAKYG